MVPIPRHVAHLHTGLEWGGGEYQVFHLVRELEAAGVTTSLWARRDGQLLSRVREHGLPGRALPGPWGMPWGEIPLCRELEGAGVDLLHCHDSRALGLGLRVARRLGARLVLARRIASPLRANPVSRAKYSPRRIDTVVAVSEHVREVFCQGGFPPSRVAVVPSGLDLPALEQLVRDGSFRRQFGDGALVAGIGRLAPKKNWPLLVRTAARVAAAGLEAHWVIAGDGPERSSLDDLARALGVAERVHLLGFRRDAAQILKNSDLLFFPSAREGAAGTVRQAMVLGVPVVAVDAPGTLEALEGHGWTVAPDDVAGAARAVGAVLTDAAGREAVCREARASARARFGFERTLAGTLDVYSSVVNARAR